MYGEKKKKKEKVYKSTTKIVDVGGDDSLRRDIVEDDVPVIVESTQAWFDEYRDDNNVEVVKRKQDDDDDDGDLNATGLQIPTKRMKPSRTSTSNAIPVQEKPVEKTIHRDKFGKVIDMDLLITQKQEADALKQLETDARILKGRGVKQQAEQEKLATRLIEEKSMNFAVYKDDVLLNQDLKEIERFDDPMAVRYQLIYLC